MQTTQQRIAAQVAERFSQLAQVEAIALAGSQTTGEAGAGSDIDIYVYTREDIPAVQRMAIGHEFASDVQIVDFWGPGLEWNDPESGIHVDTIFFDAGWMQDQLDRVLVRHEAWLGYTTCFWHTLRVSQALFDRQGWFAGLHERAQSPYPDALAAAVVRLNFPVLRDIFPSYRHQLEKAAGRGDLVSLNHRTAGLLASYFDILFAINRQTHPGEKRLLSFAERLCPLRPEGMREQVSGLIQASVLNPEHIAAQVDALVDPLEHLLAEQGLLP